MTETAAQRLARVKRLLDLHILRMQIAEEYERAWQAYLNTLPLIPKEGHTAE